MEQRFRTTRIGMGLYIRSELLERGIDAPVRRAKALGRASMQAATRPMVQGLKSIVRRTILQRSRVNGGAVQSTGASYRAVQSKVGISRYSRLFGIVSVDTNYVEVHRRNMDLYRIWAQRKGKNIGTTRQGGRSRKRFLYVKSFNTRNIKASKPLKRRPGKYWHLINRGFVHRAYHGPGLKNTFRGYWFVQKALLSTRSEAIAAFERIWYAGIRRIFYGPFREDMQ